MAKIQVLFTRENLNRNLPVTLVPGSEFEKNGIIYVKVVKPMGGAIVEIEKSELYCRAVPSHSGLLGFFLKIWIHIKSFRSKQFEGIKRKL